METSKNQDIYNMADSSYRAYQLEQYEPAFLLQEDLISLCLRERNYLRLFIALFNRELLLRTLKQPLSNKREKYELVPERHLSEKFNSLPKTIQEMLRPVYRFLDFSEIYRIAYEVSEVHIKKQESRAYIEGGGIVLNAESDQYFLKHSNFLNFVLANRIMIDDYSEFKFINRFYLKISLIRQSINSKATLTKLELYAGIKYLDFNELSDLFKEFRGEGRKQELIANSETISWLSTEVLQNLSRQMVFSKELFTRYNKYFENTLFILSLINIGEDQINKVMSTVTAIIEQRNNALSVFEAMNRFLGIQYKLHEAKVNEAAVIRMLEVMITKFVYHKMTAHEYLAITHNSIDNLYGYARLMKAKFQNISLVEKLISEFGDGRSAEDKMDIGGSLLINLYHIGTEKIQIAVRDFLLKIETSGVREEYKLLPFELMLIINDFKPLSHELTRKISDYLEKYRERGFSSDLYTLEGQVAYLVREKKLTTLEPILDTIQKLIQRHEKQDFISIL